MLQIMVGCRSGQTASSRKAWESQGSLGFKSLSHRNLKKSKGSPELKIRDWSRALLGGISLLPLYLDEASQFPANFL